MRIIEGQANGYRYTQNRILASINCCAKLWDIKYFDGNLINKDVIIRRPNQKSIRREFMYIFGNPIMCDAGQVINVRAS